MTIRRVAKDVQFLGRTIKANEAGFGTLKAGRRAAIGGAAMTHVGGAASLIGAGTLAGLGAASKQFADFDTLATQAATQIGNIDNSVIDVTNDASKLRTEILKQMSLFPASAEEMSAAAYDIFSSMDVGFNKGINLLKLFNEAAVAGMTDVETAGNGAITVLNNFDPALKHPRKTLNEMFSIIRFGRIDLETLNTMMNQIAPAAAAADQSLSDISGAIATLTRRLGPGIASAGLARLFEIFQRKDFQAGMAKAGVAITDAQGQLLPLEEIIKRLKALGPRPGKTLQNLIQSITAFGSGKGGVQATVQARRALVTLIKNYEDYIDVQHRSIQNNDQFDKQLSSMQQSLGVRWSTFVNRLRKNMLQIGEDAIPVFEDIGKKIDPLISAWEGLDKSTKSWIITTAGSVAVFTLLGGIILMVSGVVTGLAGLITMVTGFILSRLVPAITTSLIPALVRLAATARATMAILASSFAMGGAGGGLTAVKVALASILRSLVAIAPMAAIAIGLTLVFEGEGWQTVLGAALMGAGAGFMVGGPVGAIIGAITVPIILKIVEDQSTTLEDMSNKELKNFKKNLKEREKAVREHRGRAMPVDLKTIGLGGSTIKEQLASVDRELNKRRRARMQLPKGTIQEMIDAGKFAIPRTGEDVTHIGVLKKTIKKGNDVLRTGMFKDALTIDEVNKRVAAKLKENEKVVKDWAKRRNDVLQQATQEQQQVLNTAVQTLSSTYDQIQQMNESAMGELFQGPFLTGETFNLAQEWGVTAGIKDINKDLQMQIQEFQKWHGALRAIGARGVPKELLQSLEALGPDAVDKLEVLRKASPKMFARFVSLWKQRQNAIKKETKIDFSAQLKEWNQYGKDIAFQIITGLRGENVTLEKGFERYITNNFSGALQKIKDQALAEFYQENPEARKAAKNAPAIKKAGAARKTEIKQGDKTTITVHQQPGEDGPSVAKRAAWEAAQRKGRGKTKTGPPRRKHPTVRGGD